MSIWIATASALPKHDDAVQFIIDERNIVLRGRYDAGAFKSRWSCYSAADVSGWRMLDDTEARHENERTIIVGAPLRRPFGLPAACVAA